MVVKSEIKHIRNLQQKKYRTQSGLFVAEGIKMVSELLNSPYIPYKIYSTDASLIKELQLEKAIVSPAELKQLSSLQNPNKILGVFYIPKMSPLDFNDWILVLDAVNDPGNLGTIIRLCDWFGIRHLACSPGTVDCYNPKVLQATMGSIARVNIVYQELDQLLLRSTVPVYGAFMDGLPVYGQILPKAGMLVMGNEARGISPEISEKITHRIGIPRYGDKSTESLNVAMATAILLSEIRRPIQT